MVFIDDGSTDGTFSILPDMIEQVVRQLIVIKVEENTKQTVVYGGRFEHANMQMDSELEVWIETCKSIQMIFQTS